MKVRLKKLIFPVLGFLSVVWCLIRIIPKPSRASYPCMKATVPIASSFILYVSGLFSSLFAFKKAKKFLTEKRYVFFFTALFLGLILGLATHVNTDKKIYAVTQKTFDGPNQPMGVGRGIFPGRVVWIHNPDATNENCANRRNDYWYEDDNTDQAVVSQMVSDALQKLTGTESDAAAWDALFHDFNNNHDKGDVGYTSGEKFVIKLNFNGVSQGPENINTSPQVAYAILDQLINVVGAAQSDIGIGDPNINFDTPHWDKCHSEFPDVVYWGQFGGRTPVTQPAQKVIFTSDGTLSDWLPQEYIDASYMINLPVFKKHHRAGISLTSKNHFGSVTPFNGSAFHWHFSLPASEGMGDVNNGEYGIYRCFVDIMGHKDLGGKTILFLVDGLWSSINWGHPPIKWRMSPFNDDYPNSIFASQDPVAIQSVGYDFLYNEFGEDNPEEGDYDPRDNHGPFPHYAGTDDFLRQAADKDNWAEGITYDPENDGTPLPASLGVFEHWNNPEDKQYSRNLGLDTGIELVYQNTATVVSNHSLPEDFNILRNFPNPFNPVTRIEYTIKVPSSVRLIIYNQMGQPVRTLINENQQAGHYFRNWDGTAENGLPAASGVYVAQLFTNSSSGRVERTLKMILSR
jgi:hypothetical protein